MAGGGAAEAGRGSLGLRGPANPGLDVWDTACQLLLRWKCEDSPVPCRVRAQAALGAMARPGAGERGGFEEVRVVTQPPHIRTLEQPQGSLRSLTQRKVTFCNQDWSPALAAARGDRAHRKQDLLLAAGQLPIRALTEPTLLSF